MAANTANNLQQNYSRLSTSVERLSSGLRINSASDDAAGLAIRELMRADIAATRQGIRNANDAISLIQVADGALGVIDEKLIRMKELAEQAATGTYNSTQRLMIHSEFVAMGEEIDRIARATDFNGVKLLDGSLSGEHDGSGLAASGRLKIHFGTANDSAEDYYYLEIGDCTLAGLGLREPENTQGHAVKANVTQNNTATAAGSQTNTIEMPPLNDFPQGTISGIHPPGGYIGNMQDIFNGKQGTWFDTSYPVYPVLDPWSGVEQNFMFVIPKGTKNIVINILGTEKSINGFGDNDLQLFTKDGTHLAGTPPTDYVFGNLQGHDNSIDGQKHLLGFTSADYDGSHLNSGPGAYDPTGGTLNFSQYNGMNIGYSGDPDRYDAAPNNGILETWDDYEVLTIDEATEDLIVWVPGYLPAGIKVYWDLPDAQNPPVPPNPPTPPDPGPNPPAPPATPQGDIISIKTQEEAQEALARIDDAIVAKDKVRAHLGAMQNRLENTVTNLTIQGENLQVSKSQISDVDVSQEMTQFVRNQVMTQSAVAMLGQANSFPHMLMKLLQG